MNQQNEIFLHKKLFMPPSFRKRTGALHCKSFSKDSLFTTFSVFFELSEVGNICSKSNTLALKYFYARHLTLFLHGIIKLALSIAESFKNIHFLPNFYQFSWRLRCAILQRKTNLLIQQNINIFTQETLRLSLIRNWRCPRQAFSETSIFYNILTIFDSD